MKIKTIIALATIGLFGGCEQKPRQTPIGGVQISDGGGSATLFIFEKDGYKFAALVGYGKCALVQLRASE